MKRFEYKTITNCTDVDLNNLGRDGWELVLVYKIHPENQYTKFVLKRELLICGK
jgi:hypothetical protein